MVLFVFSFILVFNFFIFLSLFLLCWRRLIYLKTKCPCRFKFFIFSLYWSQSRLLFFRFFSLCYFSLLFSLSFSLLLFLVRKCSNKMPNSRNDPGSVSPSAQSKPIKKEIIITHPKVTSKVREKFTSNTPRSKQCYFCGEAYSGKHVCPAEEKICSHSKKPNHFAKFCRNNIVSLIHEEIQETGILPEEDIAFLYVIDQRYEKVEVITTLIMTNQLPVCVKLDTGAQA